MWFLGLLVGAAVGVLVGGAGAMALGALAGAIIADLLRRRAQATLPQDRLLALERQVRELSAAVESLRSSLQTPENRTAPARDAEPRTAGPEGMPPAAVDTEAIAPATEAPPEPLPADGSAPPEAGSAPGLAPVITQAVPAPLSSPWGAPVGPAAGVLTRLQAWFTDGNAVVRVGMVILFFGVAFLLNYAWEHARLSPGLRVAGALLGGLALALAGWWLRERRRGYAVALQGGGVGILYLAVFAALRLYGLLSPGTAFGLLALLSAVFVLLALRQNTQALAVLATGGGFLAPVLASTGTGSHVVLFGYYTLINLGILAIAARRPWRALNLCGFLFTFGVGALWGVEHREPHLWSTTQPFLAGFFLIYLLIPAWFARQADRTADRYLDGVLVFGLPVAALGLQYHLVRQFEYGMSISLVVAGACYLAAARHVRRRHGDALALLASSLAALAFITFTLAIPLAFDARWSAAAWVLEGAAAVWLGFRQGRFLPRLAGYLLQFGATALFFEDVPVRPEGFPLLNRDALGFLLLSAGLLFTAREMDRRAGLATTAERHLRPAPLALALLFWLLGGVREIGGFAPEPARAGITLLFLASTAIALDFLRERLSWERLRLPAAGVSVPALPVALLTAIDGVAPLAHLGLVGWPAAFMAHFAILKRQDGHGLPPATGLHALGFWLLAHVLGSQAWHLLAQATDPGSAWPTAGVLAVWALLVALATGGGARLPWPLAVHRTAYGTLGAGALALGLLAATLLANLRSDGSAAPLPTLPLLNPLDLASLVAVAALEFWLRTDNPVAARWPPWVRWGVPGATGFLVLNAVLLRALHHLAGTPLDLEGVIGSTLAQAALSLYWTVIALALMVGAGRWRLRGPWLVGAGLLGATVAKLLLIDLAQAGTVERIVSFVGVGALMLVVGWFAPVPPKAGDGSGDNPA
jgi:uncharacterized membrane protein